MDPKTLREIMGQGATRPETPQDRREREQLEADLATSPVRGRPLRQRLRNFRPDPESGVRALGGPTAWMRRLRAIEDAVEQHERQLHERWRSLALELEDQAEFAAAWRELAGNWSFARVNELIERHNRNFPAEARLAMDPRTRDFVRVNGRSYLREPLGESWILARFPADRDAAYDVIRPVRPEDAEELAALYLANREFLAPFEPVRPPGFFNAETQRERIAARAEDGFHQFAILDGDAIAGMINVFHIVREVLQSGTVGYWVDRERNGRGLATAAVEAIVAYMFGELDLHRAEAATLVENVPSQRVLEKAGFERIGLARRYLRINGVWRDFFLFQRVAD